MRIPEYYALLPASSKRGRIRVDVLVERSHNSWTIELPKPGRERSAGLAAFFVCGGELAGKQQPLLSLFHEESSF